MKHSLLLSVPLVVVAIASVMSAAKGDEPAASSQPVSQPSDKSHYTLFNPTPAAQLREMDTDRPNVTNTPHTIDAGHLQIETGLLDYTSYRNHLDGIGVRSEDFGFGEFNFRLGILNSLELNAIVDSYETYRTRDDPPGATVHTRGFGDTAVGGKLNLWGNEGGDDVWATALAIQPQFQFPTASGGVGNGRFEFTVAAPFLMNLPRGFHLGIQSAISYERSVAGAGYVAGLQNSISLDRKIIGALDVYIEYASDVTTESHVEPVQTIDVGAVYPLNENVVLDAGVNFGLNKASNNFQLLAGISVRF